MSKYLVIGVGFLLLFGGAQARGQDSEEIKRLKSRIELLEMKLRLAEADNETLRKEIAALKSKAGGAGKEKPRTLSELLSDGAVLPGDFRFLNAKISAGEVTVTIKSRNGKQFRGMHYAKNKEGELNVEIEGEINANRFGYKAINTAHKFTVTGILKGESLECIFVNSAGEKASMTLKTSR